MGRSQLTVIRELGLGVARFDKCSRRPTVPSLWSYLFVDLPFTRVRDMLHVVSSRWQDIQDVRICALSEQRKPGSLWLRCTRPAMLEEIWLVWYVLSSYPPPVTNILMRIPE